MQEDIDNSKDLDYSKKDLDYCKKLKANWHFRNADDLLKFASNCIETSGRHVYETTDTYSNILKCSQSLISNNQWHYMSIPDSRVSYTYNNHTKTIDYWDPKNTGSGNIKMDKKIDVELHVFKANVFPFT